MLDAVAINAVEIKPIDPRGETRGADLVGWIAYTSTCR